MRISKTSYKFNFHKRNKSDKEGYIYLQTIKNRKKSYSSLGLPKLKEKYWDPELERVKKLDTIDFEFYNNSIEEKLKEVVTIKEFNVRMKDGKKSFLGYFKNYIDSSFLSQKHGTRIKYQSVFNRLKKYVKEHENKDDLSFSDLNLEFLSSFQVFLRKGGVEINTTTHYLKIIRGIIRKAQKEEGFFDVKDPFVNFKFERSQKKIKEYLTKEEIQKISKQKIDNPRLNKVRKMFLFQFMSKGMRVSDILTLRLNNLINGNVSYEMFKTKNPIEFKLTLLHLDILKNFIVFSEDINDITISEKTEMVQSELLKLQQERKKTKSYGGRKKRIDGRPAPPNPFGPLKISPYTGLPLLTNLYDKYIPHLVNKTVSLYELVLNQMTLKELYKERADLEEFKKRKGKLEVRGMTYSFTKEFENVKEYIDDTISLIEVKIEYIYNKYFELTTKELTELGNSNRKNEFVFGMLPNKEFNNIDSRNDFSIISEDQYNRIHKVTVVYNRGLTELQKLVGLDKKLKSHLPRVSYTNLMLNIEGVSVFDISYDLGHRSIKVTDSYLKTGFQKNTSDQGQQKLNEDIFQLKMKKG